MQSVCSLIAKAGDKAIEVAGATTTHFRQLHPHRHIFSQHFSESDVGAFAEQFQLVLEQTPQLFSGGHPPEEQHILAE